MTARPVLAATDGSPTSLAAVHWAAAEAVRRRTGLRLVHVWPRPVGVYLDQLEREGARLLAGVRDEVAGRWPQLELETLLLGAEAVDGLLEAAQDGELLVIGSRGRGGFKGLLMGSVSLAVAGRSPIPVAVLRPGAEQTGHTDAAPAGEVVVGVSAGDNADEVLDFAFARAARNGARLVAVHAWNPPALWAMPGTMVPVIESAALESAAGAHVETVLRPWREKYPDVEAVIRTEADTAAKTLVDASDGAELLVIGRRTRRHAVGGHLGFAAHSALHHAHAPVVLVPHD